MTARHLSSHSSDSCSAHGCCPHLRGWPFRHLCATWLPMLAFSFASWHEIALSPASRRLPRRWAQWQGRSAVSGCAERERTRGLLACGIPKPWEVRHDPFYCPLCTARWVKTPRTCGLASWPTTCNWESTGSGWAKFPLADRSRQKQQASRVEAFAQQSHLLHDARFCLDGEWYHTIIDDSLLHLSGGRVADRSMVNMAPDSTKDRREETMTLYSTKPELLDLVFVPPPHVEEPLYGKTRTGCLWMSTAVCCAALIPED